MGIDEALSRYTSDEILAAFCNRQRSVVVAWVPRGVDGMPDAMQASHRACSSLGPFESAGLAAYLLRRLEDVVDQKPRQQPPTNPFNRSY